LFGLLLGGAAPDEPNVLALMLDPGAVRDAVIDWPTVAASLVLRAQREAVSGVLPRTVKKAVTRVRDDARVQDVLHRLHEAGGLPVVDVGFHVDGADRRYFSVVSTLGTPVDITAQELRIEAFFPDDATRRIHTS
jgi:hypothetical protein